MAIATFEELCKGLCEIAGFDQPRLEPDARGMQACSMRIRGVVVTAIEFGHTRGQTAYLLAEFGALPAEQAAAGWQALLNANIYLGGPNAPRFSRNPKTGEVVMQWACPLWSLTVTDVYQRVTQLVDLAQQWRKSYVLTVSGDSLEVPPEARARDHEEAAEKAARFQALYVQICEALGQAAGPMPAEAQERGVRVRTEGADIIVCHSPWQNADHAFVGVGLGKPSEESETAEAEAMMDANFSTLARPEAGTYCRDPASGQYLLQYPWPLQAGNGRDCVDRFMQLAGVARELKASRQQALAA